MDFDSFNLNFIRTIFG